MEVKVQIQVAGIWVEWRTVRRAWKGSNAILAQNLH